MMVGVAETLSLAAVQRSLTASWRRLLLVNGLLLVTACSDGYPVDDTGVLSSSEMNVNQLVTAMNLIGEKPYLAHRWRYALEPGCVLEVKVRRSGVGRQTVAVNLREADVVMKKGSADEAFDIRLEPAGQTSAAQVPVLEGGKWGEAVQMRSLLIHLQRSCDSTASS